MKSKIGSMGLLAFAAALWAGASNAQAQDCGQSPADPQATTSAKNMLCYIKTHSYITGQTDVADGDKVQQLTGRYPAIIAFDFYNYTDGGNVGDTSETQKAINWAQTKKGIVAFQWHWKCPRGGGQFSGNCDFDQDLNNPSSNLYKNIDLVVSEIKKMGDAGVTVLFRPLHEANNNYMWWAKKGQGNYIALFKLIYQRAQMAGAHNILWVFNGMANGQGTSMASWYPGDAYVDFVTSDYFQSWNDYNTIKSIGTNKTLGISETMNQIKPSSDAPWPFSVVWASRDWNGNSAQDWKNAMADPRSISIDQLPDFTTPPQPDLSIAKGKMATASSIEAADKVASNAFDSSTATRWASSAADANWISVDLGGMYNINRVVLNWEAAYGSSYAIQVSADGTNWQDIYTTTTGRGGVEDLPITGSGRYVRMNGIKRATQWGYSLWEFKVYGDPANGSSSAPSSSSSSSRTASSTPSSAPRTSSSAPSSVPSNSTLGCSVVQTGQWTGGYQIDVTVKNQGSSTINSWNVTLNFASAPAITGSWNATLTSSGNSINATNVSYNGTLAPGQTTTFGVTGNTSGNFVLPTCGDANPPASSSSSSSSRSSSSIYSSNSGTNIALNKPATATSTDDATHSANLAVDGNGTTRWSSSYADANSITVDLGSFFSVSRVKLNWEAAYGKAYQIQVSGDGNTWSTAYSTANGDGGVDDISLASAATARYVRMNGVTRATQWGYSLWDFEVYGTPVNVSSSSQSSISSVSSTSSSSIANNGGTIQVDVSSLLDGRSVSTFTNGHIVSWTTGFDGNYSGEATLAVAQALGNTNPKALPDNGFFPANSRHPDVQLHFSNADGVSNQTRYVTGSAAVGFNVPAGAYSTMHLFALSANGSSMVDVDLVYSNGTVRKSFEVPDWYNSVNDADRYVLADDLDKWSNTNARLEQGHHYIFGLDLHPDSSRVLTRIVINKQAAGALTFWGATGVAVSTVSSSSSSKSVSSSSSSSSIRSSSSVSSVSSVSSSSSSRSSSSSISSRSSTSSSTGTNGTFRVDASGNITKNGSIFPVKCGNWFGLEGQFEPKNAANNPGGAPMELLMGNQWWANTGRTLQQTFTEIKAKGINMIRLPIAPQTLDATNPQGIGDIRTGGVLKAHESIRQTNSRQALENFIKVASQNNVQVLIDIHSCSNYIGWRAGVLDAKPPFVDANRPNYDFTREDWSCAETGNPSSVKHIQADNETKWLATLKEVAGLSKSLGVDNIIGIDIFNEPWGYTWEQWKTLSEHAYQAINSVNPDILVFVEGVSDKTVDGNSVPFGDPATNPNWGENLFGQAINPLDIPKDRLVLSPHTYGPSVFVQRQFMDPAQPNCTGLDGDSAAAARCNIVIDGPRLAKGWDEHFGKLRAQGYAMVVGEFGGNMDWPKKTTPTEQATWSHITTNVDQQWQNAFVDYMKSKNIQACYWAINPESGDTLGWYNHAYDPVSNPGGWGTWLGFDQRKTDLLNRLWGQ